MKVLYITYEGFDTPNPNNQMAETMINEFLKNGFSVHLIQSSKKEIYDKIPSSLKNRSNFFCDTIKRKVVDKTHFIRRYFNEVNYAFQAMRKWIRVKDADVVYVQSNPVVVLTIVLLKIFKRKPIVYSIYDVFPGHAYDIGVINSKFVYNVLKIMQAPCYKLSNSILVLSEDMKRILVNLKVKENKIHIVPAWYNDSSSKYISTKKNKFIKKYNIDTSKFYVQFAGTIGLIFDYEVVLKIATLLKNEKNIRFQIIGDGNVKDEFVRRTKEIKLKNIDFYPIQPIEIVPDVYSTCSVCLIPLKKGVIGNGVPSKAPILMSCKKVIINSVEDSEYSKMFEKNHMGYSFEHDEYEKIAEKILFLYNNQKILKEMGENAFNYGKENYSSSKSIKKIMEIFKLYEKSK